MSNLYTKILFIVFVLTTISKQGNSQSLLTKNVTIIDNLSRNYTPAKKVFGKTSTCPQDTVKYPFYKASALRVVALNNITSGNIFAQWFDAQQPITVAGFDFYGWQSANTNQVINLNCRIYNANPVDSTPLGTPLASVTVGVDSTFGGGTLTALLRQAIFATPVTVTGPYVLTVETSSSVSVSIVTNDWTATTPNGRSEWLSSVHFGANNYYARGYSVNVGGIQFNADFLYHPYVSYSLTADFAPSSLCNQGGNSIVFTNNSSSVLFNKFYNTRAYYNITYVSCMWDYGDSSGTWYALNGSKSYAYRAPYTVRLRDTIIGWTTGCGDSKIVPLNASPAASIATSNSPVCVGATLKLFADSVPGATGYSWTGPNGFTSSLKNPTIPNSTVAHQGTYSLRAVMGQCTSAVAITLVNIQAIPQTASNSPLCVGQTLSLTVNSIPGATYSWTGPNSFSSTSQSPSKTGITQADTGLYSVMINSPGCGLIGPYNSYVNVNIVPPTPSPTNNGPLCVGSNLDLLGNGISGNYLWSGPNGFVAYTKNITRSGAQVSYHGSYSVAVTVNGCTSNSATTNVVVNPIPTTPVVTSNGPLCLGQTLALSATSIVGATYAWTGPNGFSSSLQTPTKSSVIAQDSGIYSVVATANGCSSIAGTTNVVISSFTPTPTASSNGPLCPGQTLQLTASNIPGATYSWTGPNGFTSTQQNPTISSVTQNNGGTYSVTALTSGCNASIAGNVNVVINSLPAAPVIGSNGPLCDGDSLVLTATNVVGGNYHWTGPNGFTSMSQNPVITSVNLTTAGVYSVYVDVTGCGSSTTTDATINIYRVPQKPSITGNTPVCEGDSLKLTGTSFGTGINKLYSWVGPNNFSSTTQNIAIANASLTNSGTYSLIVKDSGCSSLPGTFNTSIKSRPSAPLASNNSPVCSGNDIQLNASLTVGATYKWTGPGGYISGTQNPLMFGSKGIAAGTYSVTMSLNGCNSLPATTNVSLYNLPPTPIASNDGPVCAGNSVSLSCNPTPDVIYSWTGPNGFVSSLQSPVIANAKIGMSGIYSLTVIDSHCVSMPDTTLVTINPIPATPTATTYPTNGIICSGDSLQLYATYINGVSYSWTGPGGFASTIQNPVIHASNTSNSGMYAVMSVKSNCFSIPSTVNFVVNKLPITGDVTGPDSAITTDIKTYSILGDSGSTFSWISFGGVIQGSTTGNTVAVKWGNPGTGFVRVRETGVNGCFGTLMQKNVVISKKPINGIDELSMGNLKVYPIPANKKVTIEFTSTRNQKGVLELYNIIGEKVLEQTLQINNGIQQIEIPTDHLMSGIYYLVLYGNEVKLNHKIEIMK